MLAPCCPQSLEPSSSHANMRRVFSVGGQACWRPAARKALILRRVTPTLRVTIPHEPIFLFLYEFRLRGEWPCPAAGESLCFHEGAEVATLCGIGIQLRAFRTKGVPTVLPAEVQRNHVGNHFFFLLSFCLYIHNKISSCMC